MMRSAPIHSTRTNTAFQSNHYGHDQYQKNNNYNHHNNGYDETEYSIPTTPLTPILPQAIPRGVTPKYNMNNMKWIDNGENDNGGIHSTGEESIIDRLFFFDDDLNQNNTGYKLESPLPSPTTLFSVGSDTLMIGDINANEMGFSYNN